MNSHFDDLPESLQQHANEVCNRFEAAWKEGRRPKISEFLEQTSELDRSTLLKMLIPLDLDYRRLAGEAPEEADYVQAFPEDRETIRELLAKEVAETTGADTRAQNFDQSISERPGSVIDRYKLMEQIGEGGMGRVFVATQQKPVRRKVALKIIKPGMDTGEVIARFEAERQALALMDHPNIARVLDGGATASGRPYFVMELVRGVPITEYCDKNSLDTRERMELFTSVCQAIQHAHQKGIIHRDIKPSNVMVTLHDGEPVVKVIDFGVAKAINQQLTERTIYTRFAQMVGTPLYMSPEQTEMSGLEIDTRSDVYSLGVLLYELLTGTTPIEKQRILKAAYEEICRMIREEEPPKPSTRASTAKNSSKTISSRRSTDPRRLEKLMRGEVDWIVMKALDKDRNRRYATAAGFAEDIKRYLNNEAVDACPPSATYRFRKFARRNKAALTIAATIGLFLILATVGSSIAAYNFRKLADEKDSALTRSIQAEQIASDARAEEARLRKENVARLYDSLVRETKALYASRTPGFRDQAWRRLDEARKLDTPGRDLRQLRRIAVDCMGDYVGLTPKTLSFKGEAVTAVALNDEGTIAAVALRNTQHEYLVALHEIGTAAEITRLAAHPRPIISVNFSDDGDRLATVDDVGGIRTWKRSDAGFWQVDQQWPVDPGAPWNPRRYVRSVSVTQDLTLASVLYVDEHEISLVDLKTGEVANQFRDDADNAQFCSAILSPTGDSLTASSMLPDKLLVWDVLSGKLIHQRPSHEIQLPYDSRLSNSSSGSLIAGAGLGSMVIIDAKDLSVRFVRNGESGRHLGISPDERFVVVQSSGSVTVQLWDLVTGHLLAELDPHDSQHPHIVDIAFSRTQPVFCYASADSVTIWNAYQTPEQTKIVGSDSAIVGLGFSVDGAQLAAGSHDTTRVWDIRSGRLIDSVLGGYNHKQYFSPSGRLLGTIGGGRWVHLWSTRDWRRLAKIDLNKYETAHPVDYVAFSPDERYVAHCGDIGIWVWELPVDIERIGAANLQLDRLVKKIDVSGFASSLRFSPDGKFLAAICSNKGSSAVRVWKYPSFEEIAGPAGTPKTDYADLEFFPDSKHLTFPTHDSIHVWDLESEQPVRRFGPTVDRHLAMSSDGRLLAGLPSRTEVAIWNTESGELLATLPGGRSRIYGMAWSIDRRLAVGYENGDIVVWDMNAVRQELDKIGLAWEKLQPSSRPAEPLSREPLAPDQLDYLKAGYGARSFYFVNIEQYRMAAEHVARGLALQPEKFSYRYLLALMQLGANDGLGYRNTCEAIAETFSQPTNHGPTVFDQLFTTLATTLAPNALDDYQDMIDRIRTLSVEPSNESLRQQILGALLLRSGDVDGAIDILRQVDETQSDDCPDTWYLLAIAHLRNGDVDIAQQWVEKANTVEMSNKGDPWYRANVKLWRNEAESLLSDSTQPLP